MGPTPFEFVGNPTLLGEAAPRGVGETAPRTIAFSDAERFLLLRREPEADERILTDSSDASKPAGSPDARSGGQNRKFNRRSGPCWTECDLCHEVKP